MMDSASVITQATHGIVKELAADYECSLSRMYERLGPQCVYPKTKRLIRAIGRHNPEGVRLIKADLDAMFAGILGVAAGDEPSIQDVPREAFEAVDAMLEGKSGPEQLKELRELAAVVDLKITGIERLMAREQMNNGNIREWSKAAVDRRKG
jgi:hypothetical protein